MAWPEANGPDHAHPVRPPVVRCTLAELPTLVLAYCCTAHSSQGSDYPTVVTAVDRAHAVLLDHKLL